MQAITVKYLKPTETRGSRLKAECKTGSVTIGLPYHVDGEQAARLAAITLCDKFRWRSYNLVGGQLKNGDYVFVWAQPALALA
jgi:hypothetical protein